VDTLTVYALSGTSPSLPSGIDLFTTQPVVVDGFGNFDIAVDIESPTQARIYPVRFVVNSPRGVRVVGIRKEAGTFAQLTSAPAAVYQTDSSVAVSPGEVVVVQTTRAFPGEYCQFALQPYLYAKLSVINIDMAARTVQLALGLDPNCGFRSFQSGIPTS
jgi:hypothetical protein